MFEKLMIAFCYFEAFMLVASVILLIIAAMVLVDLAKRSKDGEQT